MAELKQIKSSAVKALLPKRKPDSYKGQNGRILIVAGSLQYHGAAILAGMGALGAGADMVYLYVPECNFEVTRSASPDFIVKKYPGEYLTERYCEQIVEFAKKKCDSVLIGPGLSDNEKTTEAVLELVKNLAMPTVLDADAIMVLKKIERFPLPQQMVITPHRSEFRDLVDREISVKADDLKSVILLRSLSMDLHMNVILKGAVDFISSEEGHVEVNHTGNAGMTVGGTGDVLAGIVATFLAQGLSGYDAARCAAYINGTAGDLLKKEKGLGFSASDLAKKLPYAMKELV